eukprot:scaffold119265_cov34-Cyclotella_meneghiniana.AAC.1
MKKIWKTTVVADAKPPSNQTPNVFTNNSIRSSSNVTGRNKCRGDRGVGVGSCIESTVFLFFAEIDKDKSMYQILSSPVM